MARRALSRVEDATVRAVGIGAVVVAALLLVLTAARIALLLSAGSVDLASDLRVAAPALERIDGIASAAWTSAAVTTDAATTGERLILASGVLLGGITWALMALAIAYLAHRARSEHPFVPALTRVAWTAAFALIVGPTAGQLLTDLGRNAILDRLGADALPSAFTLDASTWGAAIALALVALLLQLGERLQRDTEGLV